MNRFPKDSLGSFTLSHHGRLEAGGFGSFKIVYTVGPLGMDDKGGFRLVFHGAKDFIWPQFTDPQGVSYTTAECSSGAELVLTWMPFGNERPWFNTIDVFLAEGGLKPGETITIRIGDTSQGSPGFGLQTTCQDRVKFKMLVNPFTTQRFIPLPNRPFVTIGPGAPHVYKAVLPTLRCLGEPFSLRFKCEDLWGNPNDRADAQLTLHANLPVEGLPRSARINPGEFAVTIDNLSVNTLDDLVIELRDQDGAVLAQTNPLHFVESTPQYHYWGDLHGQSEETIGVNTAWRYFEFARDKAFVDICGHQGNDFQITDAFWKELNKITGEFNEAGRFVAFPGYEWSGNTAVGGDRNVWCRNEGETIHRSHRALIDDPLDGTDANTAKELFTAIENDEVVVAAHCGGRWPDIFYAHDGRTETAIEIYSTWGTFEWLLHDAFKAGYRVGVVANSDGHKGRPGASYPGRIVFPALGGLTCFLASELNRDAIFEALHRRHHYATTGHRPYLDVRVESDLELQIFKRDPAVFGTEVEIESSKHAVMGDIVQVDDSCQSVEFTVNIRGTAPTERVDLFDGTQLIETFRPYQSLPDSRRIRLAWSGARYRGRGRNQAWEGKVVLIDNEALSMAPINYWNMDVLPEMESSTVIPFIGITGGTRQALDIFLKNPRSGKAVLETNIGRAEFEVASLGDEWESVCLGGMDLALHAQRLPETMIPEPVSLRRTISVPNQGDARIYVRVTQEDGHQAWSSPIYIFKG